MIRRAAPTRRRSGCLNGVRPRRPEQFCCVRAASTGLQRCLNGVRPRRPEQSDWPQPRSALLQRLNGVRPRRPEQWTWAGQEHSGPLVSMESGLEDRNNGPAAPEAAVKNAGLNGVRPRRPEQFPPRRRNHRLRGPVSMESGLEDRNNHFNKLGYRLPS